MWFIQILVLILASYQYGLASLPYRVQTPTFQSSQQCVSQQAAATVLENFKKKLSEVIKSYISAYENKTCKCSDQDSSWTRVAYLNMTDSAQTCPSAWATINTPVVRACSRRQSSGGSCNSVFYSTNRLLYTQVCGRINGYQFLTPNAFNSSVAGNIGLDSWYVDGVSLTHGPPGSRTHVWTFVNAYYETASSYGICACMFSNYSEWPHTVPCFVGNNYFCATGSRGDPGNTALYNNPLWDGVGCTGNNTCCQFNQPPWFCRTLPTATSDDLEVRICADQETSNENTYISNI